MIRGHRVRRTVSLIWLARFQTAAGVIVEWIGAGVARTESLQAEREFDEVAFLLPAIWAEPGRRAAIVSVLKALQPP